MFAGKTSAGIRLVNNYIRRGDPYLCITSRLDTRYNKSGGAIVSHTGDSHDAVQLDQLFNIIKLESNNHILKRLSAAKYIIIEEAHFFPDLKNFVEYAVEVLDKHVTCIGLDGDYMRNPFGEILSLIPFCDSVIKLKATCMKCPKPSISSPPNDAIFTHRIADSTSQTFVGGTQEYEPLCRQHYRDAYLYS
jgi:thymidine kinase